ncbi:hypothetical protein M947_05100 [Sulfurimonas hongkongensis]|uniref:Glycine zipper domain-containing protein n=1 Tax=Sulfurimonas hongkongensis TaxID=1172190 RepID=T0L1Q8_9BACT|nr:hypothetical protein [Sulfurimonas hongkongensis]EQB39703.1 hypothetical protein M947_05100 [Sulfurimonas hongkongensis]
MDLFGFKKRKKEKDFTNEVNVAISAELERFGFANAEHFKSHTDLSKIADSSINPEYVDNNYHQQAGFSAEIKTTARTNANNIIDGKNTRISRTDDVGSVNHPQFDHVEVDKYGNPILDTNGKYMGGSQQKVFKNLDSYRKLYGKEFNHYKDAILDVPSDQIKDIKTDWNNQISKLKKQKQNRIESGDSVKANDLQKRIDEIENAKSRLRDAKVTTEEAMEARRNHNISIAKDIGKISHKAGIESAKIGGTISGGINSAKNLYAYFKGNKSAKEALQDMAVDTSKATALAYASGATSSTIGGVLKSSSNQIAQNLAKGSTPTVILQSGVILAKQTKNLLSGKIDANEFAKNIGQEGTTLATSLTGANLGAVVGTAIIPGVGTIVGGVIGGMTASIMSSAVYSELQKSIHDTEISNQQREAIKNYCKDLISQEKEYREYAMSIYDNYFDKKELEIKDGFKTVSLAIQNGEDINSGLAVIGKAFNIELQFNNTEEFKQHIKSEKTLKL